MIKGVVNFTVKSLNQLPALDGVSTTHSPKTIVTGSPPLDYNHFKLEFGEYVTIFEDNNITNTNAPRVVDAIALHHTGNLQGKYCFMSLQSGKKISWSQYTKLPITQRVINAVNMMGKQQEQPPLATVGPTFMLHKKEIHERNDFVFCTKYQFIQALC